MRSVVVVPTYQEADNVERFLTAVRAAVPAAHVIVVDDASPDGTGALAEKVGESLGHVEVLHRRAKEGLGNAYRHGFRHALDQGFEVIVQIDCDFSHDPGRIAALLDALDGPADCIIGSRYVPGGSTPGWPFYRRALSRYGNLYTAGVLRLGIHDATGGFRAYRAATLETIDIDGTVANGYAFQSETALRMVRSGLRLQELPITFSDRRFGTSKMSLRIMAESLLLVTSWALRDRWADVGGRVRRPRQR
jgi:dolichol-phosphate mannosyltransferase